MCKEYTTQRLLKTAPKIDGVMDEDACLMVEWGGDFILLPNEGDLPTSSVAIDPPYGFINPHSNRESISKTH